MDLQGLQGIADPFSHLPGAGEIHRRQQYAELLTAQSGQVIAITQLVQAMLAEGLQGQIAQMMAVLVVDLLEMVQVHHQ